MISPLLFLGHRTRDSELYRESPLRRPSTQLDTQPCNLTQRLDLQVTNRDALREGLPVPPKPSSRDRAFSSVLKMNRTERVWIQSSSYLQTFSLTVPRSDNIVKKLEPHWGFTEKRGCYCRSRRQGAGLPWASDVDDKRLSVLSSELRLLPSEAIQEGKPGFLQCARLNYSSPDQCTKCISSSRQF